MNRKCIWAGVLPAIAVLLLSGARLAGQTAPAADAAADNEETIVLSPFVVQAEDEDQGYSAKSTLAGTRIRTDLKDVGSSVSVVTKQFLEDTNSTGIQSLLVYTPNTEVAGAGGNFLGQGQGAFLTNTFNQEPTIKTRVRGLTDADNTRDFYLSDIPWDSYNIGRVDLQRGANSILFGIGSPAGIVNASLNAASFKDANKVSIQVSSFGSSRVTADFNKVLIPRELAVRLSLLRSDTKFKQDPAYKNDHRGFAAIKWDPAVLNKGSSHTSLRVNFEKGEIDSNLPRDTPPIDMITSWFEPSALNKRLFNPRDNALAALRDQGALINRPGNLDVFAVYLVNNASGAQEFAYQPGDYPGGANTNVGPISYDLFGRRARLPYWSIGGYKARSLTDPTVLDFYNYLLDGPNKHEFNEFEAYNIALEQRFFDDKVGFELAYDKQDARWGNTSFLEAKSAALTVDILSQLPFGAVPPRTPLPGETPSTVVPLGTNNPNAGRPVIVSGGGGGFWHERTREVKRATAFARLDFGDLVGKESVVAKIFGRNDFTAVASEDKRDNYKGSFRNYYVGDTYAGGAPQVYLMNYLGSPIGQVVNDPTGATVTTPYGLVPNRVFASTVTRTSPAGLNLTGIRGKVTPTSTTVLLNPPGSTAANPNVPGSGPLAPVATALPIVSNQDLADSAKEYQAGSKFIEKITSTAAVWQGYWFDGALVPMVGIRKDKHTVYSAGSAPARALNTRTIADLNSPLWFVPGSAADITTAAGRLGSSISSAEGTSKTYSLVTHLPDSWRDKLPGRLDVSLFYNQSENFQPAAGRKDIMGDQLPNPTGNTKEYGIAFRGFDDKVSLKIAHYKTIVEDSTLTDRIANAYIIGVVEAWAQNRAFAYRNFPGGGPASNGDLSNYLGAEYVGRYSPWSRAVYGYTSTGQPVNWRPAGPIPLMANGNVPGVIVTTHPLGEGREIRDYSQFLTGGPGGTPVYSQTVLDATYARMQSALTDWFAHPIPDKMIEFWGMTDYKSGPTPGVTGGTSLTNPTFIARHDPPEPGFAVSGDSISEGYEAELVANPIKGLNLAVNVSKTRAQTTNLAKSFVDWVELRYDQISRGAGTAGDIRLWGDGVSDPVQDPGHGGDTVRNIWNTQFMPVYRLFRALEDADTPELQPWAASALATYNFQEGALKGLTVGGGYRWAAANVIGFAGQTVGGVESYDISRPYKGPAEHAVDFVVGYSRQLNKNVKWRIQLNVRDAFASKDLIPVTRQVDGSPAAYRLPAPRTWAITNSFEF